MTREAAAFAARVFTAVAFLLPSAGAAAQEATAIMAQRVALEWLAIADRGDGSATWDAAAEQFQAAITRERWTDALAAVRTPLGPVVQRTIVSTKFEKSIPGAAPGDYAIVLFRTAFEKKVDGQETVTLQRDAAGTWRVAGYFIH